MAILLVVLFHAGVPGISGGYVGVDVFFVVSGFLITELLLRERARTGKTSLRQFYARRARRIIPVATLVLVCTVAASYEWLGFIRANVVAGDAEAASLFVANLHFAAQGTNYLNAQLPPSPLQHFWSLAVEEQFYFAWPALLMLVAASFRTVKLRVRLASALGALTAVSFVWSVIQTSNNGTWAYFSPLTRAWELSAGALLAVATPLIVGAPRLAGMVATWLGLAGIAVAAVMFGAQTAYPGYVAALPVLATVLVLAGGSAARDGTPQRLLGLRPMQSLGNVSYSWYLWHWPLLVIVAEYEGHALPLRTNLMLVLIALGLSYLTYLLVENPARYARRLIADPLATIFLGGCLVAFSLGFSHAAHGLDTPPATLPRAASTPKPGSASRVASLVAGAPRITHLPANLSPGLGALQGDVGPDGSGCNTSSPTTHPRYCVYGDRTAHRTLVLFGDSHASMWIPAIDAAARRGGWKVIAIVRPGCVAPQVSLWDEQTRAPDAECDRWRRWALGRIGELRPAAVLLTSMFLYPLDQHRHPVDERSWDAGLAVVIDTLRAGGTRVRVLGDIPHLLQSPPDCLSAHANDIRVCNAPRSSAVLRNHDESERATAIGHGAAYVDVVPWFCSARSCTAVVGNLAVYRNQAHISATYAAWLSVVVQHSLGMG